MGTGARLCAAWLWLAVGCAAEVVPASADKSFECAIGSDAPGFCARCPDDLRCTTPALGPEPRGSAARHPIVLLHGFNASPGSVWGFNESIADALGADGHHVEVARVHPYWPVASRAELLRGELDPLFDRGLAEKVHIIAHSMGGLDARHLISELGYAPRVASLTTISTPHRGSRLADFALDVTQGLSESQLSSLVSLWGWFESTLRDDDPDSRLRAALYDLSEVTPYFPEDYRDDPSVFYQSWAGISSVLGEGYDDASWEACQGLVIAPDAPMDTMRASFWPLTPIVAGEDAWRPNDGVVTVESAAWEHFRGCLPADHLAEVGQPLLLRPHWRTGWDYVRFYRHVAFELAELEACDAGIECGGRGPWGTDCWCADPP